MHIYIMHVYILTEVEQTLLLTGRTLKNGLVYLYYQISSVRAEDFACFAH